MVNVPRTTEAWRALKSGLLMKVTLLRCGGCMTVGNNVVAQRWLDSRKFEGKRQEGFPPSWKIELSQNALPDHSSDSLFVLRSDPLLLSALRSWPVWSTLRASCAPASCWVWPVVGTRRRWRDKANKGWGVFSLLCACFSAPSARTQDYSPCQVACPLPSLGAVLIGLW